MSFERYNLNGKTALITGGAGLLGKQHADALLEAGAHVILTDVASSSLSEAKEFFLTRYNSDNVSIFNMDVTKLCSIQDVHDELQRKKVRIDILINNAAIDPKVEKESANLEASRLESFDLSQWNLQISVGLTGSFLCSQIFGSSMAKDGKGGVILNVASDLSVIAPNQNLYAKDGLAQGEQPVKPVTYSVIKAGLVGLTKYLATYWPEEGVRCNALSPGGIYQGQNADFVSKLEALIPMGRMAAQDEYRGVVQFLCSDASAYLNGQNIVVDGGRSVW